VSIIRILWLGFCDDIAALTFSEENINDSNQQQQQQQKEQP
jgi:hypothetical protein